METLVLGLGNPLMKDDGIGCAVIEKLDKTKISADIKNGATSGFSILEDLKNYKKTIIIDAVDMGRAPGSYARFNADELLSLPEGQNFSLHEMGLVEVIKIGRSLNDDFKNVIIVGVQPKDVSQGSKLSPEVQNTIPEIIDLIIKEAS